MQLLADAPVHDERRRSRPDHDAEAVQLGVEHHELRPAVLQLQGLQSVVGEVLLHGSLVNRTVGGSARACRFPVMKPAETRLRFEQHGLPFLVNKLVNGRPGTHQDQIRDHRRRCGNQGELLRPLSTGKVGCVWVCKPRVWGSIPQTSKYLDNRQRDLPTDCPPISERPRGTGARCKAATDLVRHQSCSVSPRRRRDRRSRSAGRCRHPRCGGDQYRSEPSAASVVTEPRSQRIRLVHGGPLDRRAWRAIQIGDW